MSERLDITMEDVETAIRILNEFVKRSREATMILRRVEMEFKGSGSRMPSRMEDFMQMAYENIMAKRGVQTKAETEAQIPDVSEEDIKRMRAVRDKLKAKPQ